MPSQTVVPLTSQSKSPLSSGKFGLSGFILGSSTSDSSVADLREMLLALVTDVRDAEKASVEAMAATDSMENSKLEFFILVVFICMM